jgi:hypothetical protein
MRRGCIAGAGSAGRIESWLNRNERHDITYSGLRVRVGRVEGEERTMRRWTDKYYRELMLVSMLLELGMLGWISWHTH